MTNLSHCPVISKKKPPSTGKLNLNVVAERVENKEIQDEIVKKGIAYTQGYYFSKPMKFSYFV